ncbi:MAG: Calx-beta domain-containing protein [Patescibacteria group bacterium]|jgi:hypothetical protein
MALKRNNPNWINRFFSVSFLFIVALLFFRASPTLAAAVSWDSGGANNDWETAANWSGDAVPTDADDVTIDYAETIAINATTTINSLTVGGTNATVLNFDYNAISGGALIIDAGNLTVAANGTITHTGGSTSSVLATVFIDVQTGDVTITGTVNVDGKGYAKGYGTGKGTTWGAGGYGGEGGAGNGGTAGITYGSITAPTDLGSGGSGVCNGGAGAGAVKLSVAGGLTVAGSISATGATSNEWCASPGSGGSIYLDVGTFAGAGTVDVDGGSYNYFQSGQGGGGRIAVYYDANSYSGTPTAYGGYIASYSYYTGGAGTIYLKDNLDTYGSLTVDNNSHDYTATDRYLGKTNLSSTATYKNLTVSNDGHIDIQSGVTITVDSTLTWTGGNVTDSGGTLATVTSGDVVVPAGSYFYANSAISVTSVTVNGILTHSNNAATAVNKIYITTSGDFTIGATGTINVDERGFGPSEGDGAPSDTSFSAGGSYGGVGGWDMNRTATRGPVYGSITAPVSLGSGSGQTAGKSGGGALRLTVGGELVLTGSISANGQSTATRDYGSGSGGSIYLDATTISGAGTITANGGNQTGSDAWCGLGGGGRIAIYYDTKTYSTTPTAYGGYYPTSSTGYFGGAGTVYIKDNTAGTDSLVIDNNSRDATTDDRNFGKTPLTPTGTPLSLTVNTLTISNDGHLDLNANTTLVASTSLSWTGGNITDSGGSLATVTSGDVIVPAGSYLYANTARTGAGELTSLTVNGVLTHTRNSATAVYRINLETTNDITIGATGSVNVDERGFGPSEGDGAPSDTGFSAGGSYGGVGGWNLTRTATRGPVYGSITAPVSLGSGSGQTAGKSGGGAVQLTAGDELVITGSISANGQSTASRDYGSGSGGSIYLTAVTISGAGTTMTANGGNQTGSDAWCGLGGGGRIALYYNTKTYAGTPTAYGGYYTASSTGYFGGAGTVYLKDNTAGTDSLIIDNNSRDNTTDDRSFGKTPLTPTGTPLSLSVNALTISNDGHLNLTSDTTLTAVALTWTGGNISDNGGTLSTVTTGDVVVPTGARLLANTVRSVSSLTINGTLAHSKNSTAETYKIDYTTSGNATIVAGGSVNVDSLGFTSNSGTGAGHDCGNYGSGAGHAGVGGVTVDGGSTGGIIYDTISSPDSIGSGGGSDYGDGGSGGGAVKLTVGGDLAIGAGITADGGVDYGGDAGGGSGGSIWLNVTGACSGAGGLSADGGRAHGANAGAGAGGYILLVCGTSTYGGAATVAAGTVGYAAGVGTYLTNNAPTITTPTFTEATDGTGEVLGATIVDDSDDNLIQLKIEYSMDGGGTWEDPTLSEDLADVTATYDTPVVENDGTYQIINVTTVSGANTITWIWNSQIDEPAGDISNARFRVTAYDGTSVSSPVSSVDSVLDNVDPVGLADLAVTTYPSSSLTLTWTAVSSETHFDHYELWYGTNSSDVGNRTGTAAEWDNDNDATLATMTTATTTVTSLSQNTTYYVKIWSVDDYGNEATIAATSQKTNGLPTAATVTPTFATDGTGRTTVTVIIDDADDQTSSFKVEYSTNGGGAWGDPTLSTTPADLSGTYGTPAVNNASTYQISDVTTTSGANTISFVWSSATDVPTADVSNARIRITPYDGGEAGSVQGSSDFVMDNADPSGMASLAVTAHPADSLTLTWTAVTSETNFNHYELWYGTNSSDVDGRTGTAAEWDTSDDAALATMTTATTQITSLDDDTTYYVKIWAVDGYNNEVTIASTSETTDLGIPTVNWTSDSQTGAESAGTLTITAQLLFSYALDVTIPYTITGTATATSDYTITASPLVITAGNTTGDITITVVDDVIDELSETVIVTMGSPTNGTKGATDVHTATITDNDAAPTIAIADTSVSESVGNATVTVTMTGGSYLGVTVDYATSSGTAISGTDFTATSGTLTWAADATGDKTFTVAITDEAITEVSETVNLTLSSPTNATISDTTGLITIAANDPRSQPPSTGGGSVSNTINLTSPTDNEQLIAGSFKTITWSSTGTFGFVNLAYSTDNGVTYQTIEDNLTNSGSYYWSIPNQSVTNGFIRIEGTDLASVLTSDIIPFTTLFTETPVEEELPAEEIPTEEEIEEEISVIGMALESVLGDRWVSEAEKNGVWEIFPDLPEEVSIGTLVKLFDDGDPTTQFDSAVYYIGVDERRHAFPNEQVYKSWFSTFYGIKTIDSTTMSNIPLGPMVTYRPGSTLVKFPSITKVYAIDSEGCLRWLTSEELAIDMYGTDWARIVKDVSEAFWSSYCFGDDLVAANDQDWDTVIANY